MIASLSALCLALLAPPAGSEGPAADPPVDDTAEPAPPARTRPSESDANALRDRIGEIDDTLPFATESLQLSEVLTIALDENLDLQTKVIAVEISEANVLQASGAFDVTITAGLSAQLQRSVPRGSAFIFSTGSRSVSGYFGVSRRLETGGNISLRIDASRTATEQPISFFNPNLGSTTLAAYQITPQLTFQHPLLKGMGIKVNRAALDRAKLARSNAEADELVAAQNMIRDLVSAYWDLLYAQRDLENKRAGVELARGQLERTQAQVRAGKLAAVDAKSIEQSVAQRETDVILAENALLDASLRLRTLMGQEFAGRDELGVMPMTDPVATLSPEPVDMEAAIDRALAANPAVRQLEIALASKRIDEIEVANQRLPQLDFTGTFSPQGRSVDTSPDASTGSPGESGSWGEAFQNFVTDDIPNKGLFAEYTVTGALDLTWSVQNRAAKGNHQRVLAELRQAELNLKTIRQNTASQVITATNSMRSAAKRIDLARLSIELAEQNLDAEQVRFDVGRSTNYDVLQRIDELLQAQNTLMLAGLDYLKARAQLQALTGEILPAYGLDLPE